MQSQVDNMQSQVNKQKKIIRVYTDGACLSNGKKDSKAGIGIYNHTANKSISMNLDDIIKKFNFTNKIEKYTNNIAELLAILVAILKYKKEDCILIIHTDSMYCINSLTKWYKKWMLNDWKTANNKEVSNKEIIQIIIQNTIDGDNIQFKYVPAHTVKPSKNNLEKYIDWYGNNLADELAVKSVL